MALAAGLAVAALAWTGSYSSFESIRMKFVREATVAAGGEVRAALPTPPADRVARLPAPLALIVDLENSSDTATTLTLSVSGIPMCQSTVRRRSRQRVDCALDPALLKPSAVLLVSGPTGAWSIARAEVASHHGRTTGLGEILILPRGSNAVSPASPLAVLALALFSAVVLLLPTVSLPLVPRILHWGFVCIAIGMAAAVVASRFVSPFVLVMSPAAVAAAIAMCTMPHLWRAALWGAGVARRLLSCHPAVRRWLAAALVSVVALSAIASVMRFVRTGRGGNDSTFIHVNKTYFDGHPTLRQRDDVRQTLVIEDPGGYDVQFMYFEAFDPFIRQFADQPAVYLQFIDNPAYRYGRIGYVWMVDLVSLGDWHRFPTAMLLILVVAAALCVFCVSRLAQLHGLSAWWGLLALLIPGIWQSLFNALPEAMVAAAVLAGYLAWHRRQVALAALAFAVALLTRETALIAVACLAGAAWVFEGRRRDAFVLSLAIVPLVLWHIYVGIRLMPAFGAAAFFGSSPVIGTPLAGVMRMFTAAANHAYFPDVPILARAGFWFPPVLVTALVTALALTAARPSAASVTAVLYGAIAVSFSYAQVWSHVSNGQRASYELFVWLAVGTITAWRSVSVVWRVALGLCWLFTGVFTFGLSFDGEAVRAALPVVLAAAGVAVAAKLTARAEMANVANGELVP